MDHHIDAHVGRTHQRVRPGKFVISDAGDHFHRAQTLAQQRRNHVHLIEVRGGHHQIGIGHACALKILCGGGVSFKGQNIALSAQTEGVFVTVENDDIVFFLREHGSEIVPDLARSDDDHFQIGSDSSC
jgi:hypothetical protein